MKIEGLVFWFLWCLGHGACLSPLVPPQLEDCYRGGARARLAAPRTLPVLLEALRRLERQNTQYNMRMLTLAALYYLRLDGIEQSEAGVETAQVLPYSATGHQFQRYRLLLDVFLPAGPALPEQLELPAEDMCLLHDMLSSTVDRWERGDESTVCPLSMEQRSPTAAPPPGARGYSRCPVERGVTQTPWGPVAMGTVLAAIAAALEPQDVLESDAMRVVTSSTGPRAQGDAASALGAADALELVELGAADEALGAPGVPGAGPVEISNLWVATLAGDLAEVAVNQGPRSAGGAAVAVGTASRWNDTRLPRQLYLEPRDGAVPTWHITDAETLAGIDGLIIAQQLPAWLRLRPSLRLSQVLHMYYGGTAATASVDVARDGADARACARRVRTRGLWQRATLLAQLCGAARVLAAAQGAVYVPASEMGAICENTLAAFDKYLDGMLELHDAPCSSDADTARAPLDLVVATGGTWKSYEVERFLNWATSWAGVGGAESGDAGGVGGGSVTLLHGNTGAPIAQELHSTPLLYMHTHSYTAPWPDRLNLPTVLTSLHNLVSSRADLEYSQGLSAAPPTVLLVLSLGDRPSAQEVRTSRGLVETLRASYFDTYLVFVAQDLESFYDLDTDGLDYSNIFVKVTSSQLEEVTSALAGAAAEGGLATRLLGPLCAGPNGTAPPEQVPAERYVDAGAPHRYRLHPNFLQGADSVTIELSSMGMGVVRACWARGGAPGDTQHEGGAGAGAPGEGCAELGAAPGARVALAVPAPCPSPAPAFCPPLTLTVHLVSTLNNCANLACTSPGSVGYSVIARGLACARRYRAGAGPSTPRAALAAVLAAILTARHVLSLT